MSGHGIPKREDFGTRQAFCARKYLLYVCRNIKREHGDKFSHFIRLEKWISNKGTVCYDVFYKLKGEDNG